MNRRLPTVLAAVPIKPFGVAKARLASLLEPAARTALGRAIAQRSLAVVAEAADAVAVVTGDTGVARWASRLGAEVIQEAGPGLDTAAGSVIDLAAARGVPWAVVHADLPLLQPADLVPLLRAAAAGRAGLAPSHDGGTSILAGTGDFRCSYGIGSFHRHLRHAAPRRPLVSCRAGSAVDLDEVDDIRRVLGHPAGAWLKDYLP